MIDKFPPHRHPDLWSGVGLAASYAGGATEAELRAVWDRAGAHRAAVAQGCAFASKARVRAGHVTSDTRIAAAVFCGSSPESAAAVTDAARVDLPADRDVPSYQAWRQRIAGEFATRGRC
jgi:hypothetical protein